MFFDGRSEPGQGQLTAIFMLGQLEFSRGEAGFFSKKRCRSGAPAINFRHAANGA
jgi:hypothetical protein